MKKLILILLIINSTNIFGQNSKRDSLIREVDAYAKTVNEAANQFLNKRLSAEERIKAIESHPILYDETQKEQFKQVVLDNEERPEVRAMALNKIHDKVHEDQQLMNLEVEWLGNSQTPKVLRQEALKLAAELSFSSIRVMEVYQRLLTDPETDFRIFGFTQLIIHGDARAQQLLIRGLENPESSLLPIPTAIQILSMSVKNEHYPAVYKVLIKTTDEDARLAAISALGFYKEARERLIQISRNADEKPVFREAALGALYGGDRANIVSYVTPLLTDKSATPRLQAIGIQMTIDIRQSMAYRKSATKADKYDQIVKTIAEGRGVSTDEELILVANKYLQTVRPRF
jgi:hypothetical protein